MSILHAIVNHRTTVAARLTDRLTDGGELLPLIIEHCSYSYTVIESLFTSSSNKNTFFNWSHHACNQSITISCSTHTAPILWKKTSSNIFFTGEAIKICVHWPRLQQLKVCADIHNWPTIVKGQHNQLEVVCDRQQVVRQCPRLAAIVAARKIFWSSPKYMQKI